MKRKKAGPKTVTFKVYNQSTGELIAEGPMPIHKYTRLQMLAQARSRTVGREVTVDEMFFEVMKVGLEHFEF